MLWLRAQMVLVHLFADRPADDEFYSLVAQHHTFVIPTLSVLAPMSAPRSRTVQAADRWPELDLPKNRSSIRRM
jgi:hypothetical protein